MRWVVRVDVSWLDALQRDPIRSVAEIQLVRAFMAFEDLVWAFVRALQRCLDLVDTDENEICTLQRCWKVDDLL